MKKNLMSVIILALVFANFVLTALLVFSMLPGAKKQNELIEKVCSAIDLELNSGAASGPSNIPIDQIEVYQVNGGTVLNMNLKAAEGDKESHFAVLSVDLSLNTKSDNYEKYPPEYLSGKDGLIRDDIIKVVGSYTKAEFDADPVEVQNAILADLQNMFGRDYIVGVSFSSKTTQ